MLCTHEHNKNSLTFLKCIEKCHKYYLNILGLICKEDVTDLKNESVPTQYIH